MDRGAWWAAVHRVSKSRTGLKQLSTHHAFGVLIIFPMFYHLDVLTSISALLTMPKPLTVWITINCGKF